ncbi:exo-alpha-sialidase [Marinihelvus fidelis]|uniref:exo-alpha-sialidase n=1 Tax=Marinihelvus fidelis TaxID=2613842 RepID=UPI001781F8A2|nr:exo-alpha-sialidase [Marinihelvus fidelis]
MDTPTSVDSLAPRLAATKDDRVVISWLEPHEKGHRLAYALFSEGQAGPAHTIHQGEGFFANWADTPGVVVMPDGTWLAHWLARSGQGTYAYDVMLATSADQGATWSVPFSPHDDGTPTEHGFVSSYPASPSAVGLAWLDGRETAPAPEDAPTTGHAHGGHGAMTLRTALIAPDGTISEGAQLDDRVCDCCGTAAAVTADGPVVVYRDRSDDEIRDIMLVRRGPAGWSEPVRVHADEWRITACPVNGPAVLARGRQLVVAWFTMAADETPRVNVAVSTDSGVSFSTPVALDTGSAMGRVDLAWAESGFILVWMAENGSGANVNLAKFDLDGRLVERGSLVELDAGRGSGFPRIAALDGGRILLAWTGADGVQLGIVDID